MTERKLIYFASDVHLGLEVNGPEARERRFIDFLKRINAPETHSLYLLGDVWDFWYEYRDVIPKDGVRTIAALAELVEAGIAVYFFPGNHDIWTFGFLETFGIKVIRRQPVTVNMGGRDFCLAHGDGLGLGLSWYNVMNAAFKCRLVQGLFSLLHPWIAYRIGRGWSQNKRMSRGLQYHFAGTREPLYKFSEKYAKRHHVDYFIYGHLHTKVDTVLHGGQHLIVLDSWISGGAPYACFDGETLTVF